MAARSPVAGTRGILFTDMVGSSQMRSRLGDVTADAVRRVHDALLGSTVTAHGGRVLRWTGDGLKADFPTASAAVSAAVDMQRSVAEYSQGADAISPFQIRIGISVGEIVDEDDDDHGVAVIEAARLEALAAPGEILATDLVQRLGDRRVEASFEDVGSQTLKGLDEPITIVRVIDTSASTTARPLPRSLALDQRFPLVGRRDDVRQVLSLWDDVCLGAAATVLVAGQPGIGKSRFMAQVADRLHTRATVLAGHCDSDLAVPFQPFAAALAEAPTTDEELIAAVVSGAGPLGPLFPARRTGRFDDAGPSARFELFEAVVALVERLAGEQPVVLVLEDLQWAAPPTVQLLRHLVRETPRVPLLILASYRAEEIGPTHPLRDLLADTHTADTVTKLELSALDASDVAALVVARTPNASDENVDAFARRVWDESGGSPFFVCELLDHLSATGALGALVEEGGGDVLPIPDSVRDVVAQRLARLPDEATQLLPIAAVIGATFDLALLARLADRPPEDVLEVVEDIERVALVHEVDADRFTFAHAIVRSTVLDAMSASRLRLGHERVAETIEAFRPTDHDELAHHWRLAGVQDKANASLERAAERDLEALAYESAVERYQALLDDYARLPDADLAARARAWLGLGRAQRSLGQDDFIIAIEEAGRLGRRLRDTDIVAGAAMATLQPGPYFVSAGETQTGLVELGQAALDMLDGSDPRRVRVLSTLAAHLTYDDDRERRVALVREADDLAEGFGDPELVGSVLVTEYMALWDPTTFTRRAEIARGVARMARASGDAVLQFFAGFFAAISATERCDVDAARRHLDGVAPPIVVAQNAYYGFLADRLSVSLDILTARPGVQEEIDALAQRYESTYADTAGTWTLQTGKCALQAGGFAALAPALERMIEESFLAATWRAPYGLALLSTGDRAGAEAILDDFDEPPLDFFWLTIMQTLSELAVGLGRTDRCRELFEALMPQRGQLGITASGSLCFGLVSTTLGQLADTVGDHAVAVELLEEAVEQAVALSSPYETVKSRRLLAGALLADGRSVDEVRSIVQEAASLADQHGYQDERKLLAALQ